MAKRRTKDIDKGLPRLRGNLLLQYAAAIYELQASQAKLEAKDSEIKRRAEADPTFAEALSIMSQRAQLESDKHKSFGKLRGVATKVCNKLDIPLEDFKNYTVDTETGKVTFLPHEKTQP